jgi:hypothetical protein
MLQLVSAIIAEQALRGMKIIMSELELELQNPIYAGMTHEQKLTALHGIEEYAIGRIEQGNLKVLEAIIADGLWRNKMVAIKESATATLANADSTAEEKAFATIKLKVAAGFHEAIAESKLANKAPADAGGHSVNMSDPKVQQTFGAAQMQGIELLTPPEVAKVMTLATFKRKKWSVVTLKDVIAIAEPELLNVGEWQEFGIGESRKVRLKTSGYIPQNATVLIQYCESDDGETWTDWRHATAMSVVNGFNFAAVPHNGLARRMRWRGSEYAVSGVMVGV